MADSDVLRLALDLLVAERHRRPDDVDLEAAAGAQIAAWWVDGGSELAFALSAELQRQHLGSTPLAIGDWSDELTLFCASVSLGVDGRDPLRGATLDDAGRVLLQAEAERETWMWVRGQLRVSLVLLPSTGWREVRQVERALRSLLRRPYSRTVVAELDGMAEMVRQRTTPVDDIFD